MSVEELIILLEKVQHKEAAVFMNDSGHIDNLVNTAIIEHDLKDDEIVVVLKPED